MDNYNFDILILILGVYSCD